MESIQKITLFPIEIPFKQMPSIASADYPAFVTVLVKIQTEDGTYGYGEAIPDPVFTGETVGTVLTVLKNQLGPAVLGLDMFSLEELHQTMDRVIVGNPCAKAALDLACYDLIGKLVDKPISRLLGGSLRTEVEYVPEILFGSLKELLQICEVAVGQGAKCLKVKIGEGFERDVEKIRLLRQHIGFDVELILDANQGWKDYQTAKKIVKHLEKYEVTVLEQPLPAEDLRGMARLRTITDIPIMLDESIHVLSDALRAIELDACDIVSLKLMKSGGIWPGRKLVEICAAHSIPVHSGTMWESEVGWAANLHMISAFPKISLWDAYSPTEIYWGPEASLATPITTKMRDATRILEVPNGAGLGVIIIDENIQKYQTCNPIHME